MIRKVLYASTCIMLYSVDAGLCIKIMVTMCLLQWIYFQIRLVADPGKGPVGLRAVPHPPSSRSGSATAGSCTGLNSGTHIILIL